MDNLSISSGPINESTTDRERHNTTLGMKGETEMTLMRVRRLSRIVMSKNERHHFETRKLYRSNIVKFLESHLTHSSEKVRYLTLELFCCTIPRLANKTDSLLKPVLPKVFRCLQGEEDKDMKLEALHFLRCYFRHTKSLSDFIETFVRLGIQNPDSAIQISCCLGLNIVFDQDIGNNLFFKLVLPMTSAIRRRNKYVLIRAIYRALKHIHTVVGDMRFSDLIKNAHPEGVDVYKSLYASEESDIFLSADENSCSDLVSKYQINRKDLKLSKDFGIFNPALVDRIRETRNCERAKAVCDLVAALKHIAWADEELKPHIEHFLKLINAFVCDSNRLIQMSGFQALKVVISRMGFTLAPHIRNIVDILKKELTSANSKIRSKVNQVLHKLMRNMHPMTVIWELLRTSQDASLEEAVLILIQDKLGCFPYHKLDMIALCNYLGHNLENKNSNLAKWSKDCVILLLDVMRDCPVYGMRTTAVKVLLRNHKLGTETLRDIGILGINENEEYPEGFGSYSEDETTDLDTISLPTPSGLSTSVSHRSISTAGKSGTRYSEVRSDFNLPTPNTADSRCASNHHVENKGFVDEESDREPTKEVNFHVHTSSPTVNWGENFDFIPSTTSKQIDVESSDASSIKEHILSSTSDSIPSTYVCRPQSSNFELNNPHQQWAGCVTPECLDISHIYKETETVDREIIPGFKVTGDESRMDVARSKCYYAQNGTELDENSNDFFATNLRNLHSGIKSRKCFTRFSVKKDGNFTDSKMYFTDEKQAGGDADLFKNSTTLELHQGSEIQIDSTFITGSYEENGVQVNVLDRNLFNFNIMQVEHPEIIHEAKCATSNKAREHIQQRNKYSTPQAVKKNRKYSTPKWRPSRSELFSSNDETVEFKSDFYKSQNKIRFQRMIESNVNRDAFGGTETNTYHDMHDGDKVNTGSDSPCGHEKNICRSILGNVRTDACSDLVVSFDGNAKESPSEVEFIAPKVEDLYIVEETDGELAEFPSEIINGEIAEDYEKGLAENQFPDTQELQELGDQSMKVSIACSKNFEEADAPFIPKTRELPRTPVKTMKEMSLEIQPKLIKTKKVANSSEMKKTREKKEKSKSGIAKDENSGKYCKTSPEKTICETDAKIYSASKQNSPQRWKDCQWKRDLEYAAKAAPCPWAELFENKIQAMKPYPSTDVAENEMKKAIDELYGKSWKEKEEAMLAVIRLAKYHPELVQDNTAKILLALSNEIKNFRQSVAGKAILTTGHLYEIMGKNFENKLRIIVAALLAKSRNRTFAAYFRLVIKSLFKICSSTSPQKAIIAFATEGSKHSNKAARETAAQFISLLTERLGPENSLTSTLANTILRCAAAFVFDGSALTRYCGKRMFKVFMKHPEFEKIKDHQLDIDTIENLSNVLEQIKTKDVREEILPINLID